MEQRHALSDDPWEYDKCRRCCLDGKMRRIAVHIGLHTEHHVEA